MRLLPTGSGWRAIVSMYRSAEHVLQRRTFTASGESVSGRDAAPPRDTVDHDYPPQVRPAAKAAETTVAAATANEIRRAMVTSFPRTETSVFGRAQKPG